jgi:hypothetical protein
MSLIKRKISGTTKKSKLFTAAAAGCSSLSLFFYKTMPAILKKTSTATAQNVSLFAKQHSTLLVTAIAASSFLYYYLHTTRQAAHSLESLRKKGISKRKLLQRPEEKYASLKVTRVPEMRSRNIYIQS